MKKTIFILLALLSFSPLANAGKLTDFFDRKDIETKIREGITDLDLNAKIDLGDIELAEGVHIANSYKYEVEASYISKYYTRVDKWDINGGIDVGTVLKDYLDVPFGFSINRSNSFFFVRQFPSKVEAMKALPYGPQKLPLNAKLALKNLHVGDFVSMPANLNVGVMIQANTAIVAPMIVAAQADAHLILSGEFTVQVFKTDDTHVRLKLITKRARDVGANASVKASLQVFGVRVFDHALERIVDTDFAQLGVSFNPGSQFILDYIFDLSDPDAQLAYNQILSSTYKFKDAIIAEQLLNAHSLKDKMISSYTKADELFKADRDRNPKDRRVHRIFKGFDDFKGHTNHIKFGLLLASYQKDSTLSDSRITFIDKDEKNLEFYYPTYSRYIESHLGRRIFDLKDQNYQINFGLIPRFETEINEGMPAKNPDLGITFERKDRYYTTLEQKVVNKFLIDQIPEKMAKNIDFSQWKDGSRKYDSRIFFQLVLKSKGFDYLKNYSTEELKERIVTYVREKRKIHIIAERDIESNETAKKIKDFLMLGGIAKERLQELATSLGTILQNPNAEEMTKQIVALNEFQIFDKIGVGFLISLLPEDQLEDLVYLKLEMIGKRLNPVLVEKGNLVYRNLYKELTETQSRLSNRGYDLRLSDQDREISELDIDESFVMP